MIAAIYEVGTGRITALSDTFDANAANKQARIGLAALAIPGWIDDQEWYVVNADADDVPSELAPRPVLNVTSLTVPVGATPVAITGPLPEGTTSTIDGAPAEMSAAWEVLHVPAAAGVRHVAITPPWPWRPASIVLTVEA
ncbi:MAG: hypothetical protein B7Y12_02220 [Rhizobiales bacterium 24-66-13]|jgi:hypothetical protein|nr:MAG: hypothetical protein B7Z41_05900 [Rhizobiales bacterium 12-66-7]OYY88836.1 MAG: hypothetical protein B7Y61_01250 [Rhizobiales bacterium 35-66-30]OYZ82830.1 MAG: hypothetical protein B7Y12_02220 [Rhizobiales bacterium 24-66-13]OZB11863.1 MAG: hypothetical protein B7X67_02200 [Rhizobiales bacterium 39-66-18]HQS08711.1 hypothetical protein [Xanthobacteraceae bacterium]